VTNPGRALFSARFTPLPAVLFLWGTKQLLWVAMKKARGGGPSVR